MNQVSMWMGRQMTELTRDELLEVIDYCGKEIQQLREDRDRWMRAADPVKYLMVSGKPRACAP